MNNNIDTILGITSSQANQTPFIINLINQLKNQELIKEGITIPFLIGAYKIQENDTSIPTLEYIKSVFEKVINSLGEYKLFIKTCSNINQYVISIIGDKDIDIIGNNAPYPYIAGSSGCKVLFFEEYFDVQVPSIENISEFFWEKYKDEIQTTRYSYVNGKWQLFSSEERLVINQVLRPAVDKMHAAPYKEKSSMHNFIVRFYYFWLIANFVFFLLSQIEGKDLENQMDNLFPFNGDIGYYDITELLFYCAILPLIILGTYVSLNKLMRQAEKIHRGE